MQETINTWWFADIKYDTLTFDYTPNYPVNVSYVSDSIDKGPLKVCAGDTVDFHVFNNGQNHYDPSFYNYYWFSDNNYQDTLLVTDSLLHFSALENSKVYLHAVFKSNTDCVSQDSITVEVVVPIEGDVVVSPMECFQTTTEATLSFTNGGQENTVITWKDVLDYHQETRSGLVGDTTYSFTIRDENYNERCAFDTTFEVIGIRDLEIANIIDDSTVCYDSTGEIAIEMVDKEISYSYSWSGGAFQDFSTMSNLTAADYTVRVRDDSTGCELDTVIPVTPLPFEIEVTATNETCHDSSGTILLSIPSDKLTVVWTDGFPENELEVLNLTAGTYEVNVFSNVHSNCSVTSTVEIININHEVVIEELIIKQPDCIQEVGSVEVRINPFDDNTMYAIAWQDIDPTVFDDSFQRTDLSPKTYQFRVREEGGYCFADSMFTLKREGFEFDVQTTGTICTAKIGTIEVVIDNPKFIIDWGDANTNSFIREDLESGRYYFSLENPDDPSCALDTFVSVGQTYNILEADFEITYYNYREEMLVEDSVLLTNTSITPTPIVEWEISDGSSFSGNDFMYAFGNVGDYDIVLTIEDQYGCRDTVTKPVRVVVYKACGIAMPNAFTPNKDDINDDIGVLGYADEIELRIYNRWGEIVYRSFVLEERWDGCFRDGEAPVGTYIYQLDHTCIDTRGNKTSGYEMGEITLIR